MKPHALRDDKAELARQAGDELEDSAEDLFFPACLLERAGTPTLAKIVAAHAFEIRAIAKKLKGEPPTGA